MSYPAAKATIDYETLRKVIQEGTKGVVAVIKEVEDRLTAVLLTDTTFSYDNSAGTAAVEAPVLSTPLSIAEPGILTIQFYIDYSTTVKVGVARGGVERKALLNSGSALEANSWYEFSINVVKDDAVQVYVDVPAGTKVTGYFAFILRKR